MGSHDYGSQTRTVRFYAPADAEVVNKIGLNIRKIGLYEGGYLTKVSDVSVTLSQIEVEIGDGSHQIRVETANTVTVTVAVATPYVILRWAYTGATLNYMDVMAVASGSIQANDVVVGKCNFTGSTLTGFDYSERSNPEVFERFCQVVPEQTASMYLRVRAGRVNFGSVNYDIVDQKTSVFAAPGSGSRIDLVYINSSGSIAIEAGVADASPSPPDYGNKLVLAEITIAAGQTTITTTSIKDVRSFLLAAPKTALLWSDMPNGVIVQTQYALQSTVVTTSASVPYDNTPPQLSEMVLVTQVTITPKQSTDILHISAVLCGGQCNGASATQVIAIFKDSETTPRAVAHTRVNYETGPNGANMHLNFDMVAGTTSAITFKLYGGASGGAFYGGAYSDNDAKWGGTGVSSIRVEEEKSS